MKLKTGHLIAFFLILSGLSSFSQKTYLSLKSVPQINFKKDFSNNSALNKYLDLKIKEFKKKGFAEANIDSLHYSNDTAFVYLHLGDKYFWEELEFDSIPLEIISYMWDAFFK